MIIKKFTAKTEEDAVAAAKQELGEGIVIMNVKSVKPGGLFGVFRASQTEVTVALEEERETLKQPARAGTTIRPEESVERKTEPEKAASSNIEKKLDSLQSLLESQIKNAERIQKEELSEDSGVREPENVEENKDKAENAEQDKFVRLLYNTMIDNEVDEKYANQMLEDIEKNRKPNLPLDFILANIYQKMILKFGKSQEITPAEQGPKLVVFIGPTGVGKTTTIAKLASVYTVEKKKKVALFTTDTYRIAAVEQLRTYADILEVPARVIYTGEEFAQAIQDFKAYDYIFVDTAGHSYQNAQQLGDMKKLISFIGEDVQYQCFLVLSATTKYKDLLKIAANYKDITDYQMIFTKLDETTTLGSLLNLKLMTDTPIAYVTYGQNVPNDIEPFNPQKVVKRLLGGRS
ncbi:MAG: flagellar biosynthesis protein FlhF [Roseburia sp.]|nr:flagellar biosynthesis protein FlhF [Roseburia sp.]